MTALVFEKVRAGYGPYKALNDLDATVNAGEAVAVLGRNGVGKSTLARVASGLVTATSGRVEILGQSGRFSVHALARRGVVHLPEGVGLFTGLSIEENLSLRLSGASKSDHRDLLASALDSLGALAARRKVKAGLLSGGQQRLVAVAGAVAARPKLLLADEPALGLSPAASDDVYEALAAVRSSETALVVIETRLGRVEGLCQRALVMETGSAIYDGPIDGAASVLAALLNPNADE
jgi:branched-chain amino acid transport system ATP-binding protein